MRLMTRNKRKIYYSLYLGYENVTDSDGYKTGERTRKYSDPAELYAVVSASTGEAEITEFGNLTGYDRVVTTDDTACPINEKSHLWIEIEPDGRLHDYEVIRVAKSFNSIAYAVAKVAQNGY